MTLQMFKPARRATHISALVAVLALAACGHMPKTTVESKKSDDYGGQKESSSTDQPGKEEEEGK